MQHKATINIGVTVKYADPAKTKEYYCSGIDSKSLRPSYNSLETLSRALMFRALECCEGRPAKVNIFPLGKFERQPTENNAVKYAMCDRELGGIEIIFGFPVFGTGIETYSDSGRRTKRFKGVTFEQVDTGDTSVSCEECAARPCQSDPCRALCGDPFDCPPCTIWTAQEPANQKGKAQIEATMSVPDMSLKAHGSVCVCNRCGRQSWNRDDIHTKCDMNQANGAQCGGTFHMIPAEQRTNQ